MYCVFITRIQFCTIVGIEHEMSFSVRPPIFGGRYIIMYNDRVFIVITHNLVDERVSFHFVFSLDSFYVMDF